MLQAETPLAETIPKNKSSPLLMTMEVTEEEPSYFAYVDSRTPIFSVSDPIEAICHLLAVYFAFSIDWPKMSKFPLWALFSIVAKSDLILDLFSQNGKFCAFLKQIGIET